MIEMKVTYDDVDIIYDERGNVWRFTLRGRDRSAESLAKAKEFIDKPVAEKKVAFVRVPAWHGGWHDPFVKGEITGIAESARYSMRKEVWFATTRGRHKQDASDIYPVSEHNDKVVARVVEIDESISKLKKERDKITHTMTAYVIPEE